MSTYIPENYKSLLTIYDTQKAISLLKRLFEENLGAKLNLYRVSAPLFVDEKSGLNDDLNGYERPVSFDILRTETKAQVVQSLAKWKRLALKRYGFFPGKGLYTDMNAVRRDEDELDNLHSVYVDQWDWEKNSSGEITAISSNMARINALSAQILDRVVGAATDTHTLTVKIPAGNLTGISLLMGRGPSVPVQIIVLTSSRVEFSNSIVTAGINQTKHQINLNVIVDIDILIPWGTESAQVVTEVLIADTVVVGKVPDTYLNMQ